MALAIRTESLSKAYGRVLALRGLDLEVEEGTVFGYLGPNGAGKTTTMKILSGLARATAGRAWVAGVEVTANPRAAQALIGAVVEVPRPYPHLTVAETLRYLGELRGLKTRVLNRRVEEVLGLLGLEQVAGRRGSQLSRGMQQRLALGAAILASPPVLLLDEPTSGLDPAGIVEVRNLVRQEAARGAAVFLSSHLLREVQETADVVGFLHRGVLLRVARVSEDAGAESYILEFAQEPPAEALEVASRMPGVVSLERKAPLRFALGFRGSPTERGELVAALVRRGAKVSYLGLASPGGSLEEMYISLIGGEGEE